MTKQGRHLVLTAEGEKLMSYARRLLALNDETLRALQGERLTGEIHLGMQEDFGESLMPGILGQFKRHHPQVRIVAGWIAMVRCAGRWRKRRWIWRCCGKPKIRVPGWASARWRGLRILTGHSRSAGLRRAAAAGDVRQPVPDALPRHCLSRCRGDPGRWCSSATA